MKFQQSNRDARKTRLSMPRAMVAGALLAIMFGATGTAHAAGIYTFTLNQDPNTYYENAEVTVNGQTVDASVGLYSATLKNNNTGATTTTNAFCVDYTHNIDWNSPVAGASLNYLTDANNGLGKASYNNSTSGTHTAQANADAVAYLVSTFSNTTGLTTEKAAEAQVAIWDIVDADGNTSDVSVNNSKYGSNINMSNVDADIAAAYANGAATTSVDWVQNPKVGSYYQDFAFSNTYLNGNPNFTVTPEPGSVAMLLGLGTTGIGLLRRSRIRRAKK